MRKIVSTILTMAIFSPLTLLASSNTSIQSEYELRDECSYEISGVRECLEKKQKISETELMRAEKKIGESFAKWDEDPKFINLAKVKLVASKKAFIQYREAQCAFATSLGGGAIGNALDMRHLACVAELNNRRAEQLRSAISSLPLK